MYSIFLLQFNTYHSHNFFFFIIITTSTTTTTTVKWYALSNKLGISPDLPGSSTSEEAEETEKVTRGNGDQEDIDLHPTVISIIIYYMNKKTILFWMGFIPLCDHFPSIDEIDRRKHYEDLIEVIGVATTAKVSQVCQCCQQ